MTYLAMLNNPSKIRRSADDFQNVIGSVLSKENGKISMKIESIVFTWRRWQTNTNNNNVYSAV